MEKLSQRVLDYTLCEGACSAGIATVATLEGGPPSTDLSYVMPGARSAVVFAIPLDQDLIPGYLGKVDRPALEKNNETVNSIASGVAVKLANFMTQKGHPAVPLAANDVYRDDTPKGRVDMLPPVSLRYLAVASGVGCFGLSGNVLVKEHGGGVVQNPDGKLEAVRIFKYFSGLSWLGKGESTWKNPQEGITSYPLSSGGIRTGFRRRS